MTNDLTPVKGIFAAVISHIQVYQNYSRPAADFQGQGGCLCNSSKLQDLISVKLVICVFR